MTADALATEMANTERRRLRALVEVRLAEADALHAPDFELVHPSGGVWSKEQYYGNLAVLRYRSLIDIAVLGQEAGLLECWHLDCYRREQDGGLWRARWSQATSIDHP